MYLNTSHVTVNRVGELNKTNAQMHLNTSHVTVNRKVARRNGVCN